KQRVRLPMTAELENWILQNIAEARRIATGPIPAPLVHSPKCVRCSLAPVCLPDETRMLAPHPASGHPLPSDGRGARGEGNAESRGAGSEGAKREPREKDRLLAPALSSVEEERE